jgi:hypothetical protein
LLTVKNRLTISCFPHRFLTVKSRCHVSHVSLADC